MAKEKYDYQTPLHYACENNAGIDVITKLIDIGGRKLVMKEDKNGRTSLWYACENNAGVDVITMLVDVGGRELLMLKERYGPYHTSLNALQNALREKYMSDDTKAPIAIMLLRKSIEFQIRGEFAVGGLLFDPALDDHNFEQIIYDNWEDQVIPALRNVVTHRPHEAAQLPPILQATIIHEAPPHVIKSTVQNLDCMIGIKNQHRPLSYRRGS